MRAEAPSQQLVDPGQVNDLVALTSRRRIPQSFAFSAIAVVDSGAQEIWAVTIQVTGWKPVIRHPLQQ